jgi:hypothetical protein
VSFNPLWQLDELQQAERRLKTSQADEIDIRSGVLRAEEAAVSRYGGEGYSTTTTIDLELREEMQREVEPEVVEGEQQEAEKPTADPKLAEVAVDPSTALNGAQVSSMVEVISKVANGELPRGTGVAILTAAFPLTPAQAEKIMGTVGRGFVPAKPETPDGERA